MPKGVDVDCEERERLIRIMNAALSDLARFSSESQAADAQSARERQKAAYRAYREHIARHRCLTNLEIGALLKKDLENARLAHLAAAAEFSQLVRECPSGLPHPDGSARLQQANQRAKRELEHYMQALKRFSDFVLSGEVPDDLFHGY